MKRKRGPGALPWLALAFCALGCADRTFLTASHGRALHAATLRQTKHPAAGESGRPIAELDSQDAAVIAHTYRSTMVPKGERPPDQRMLLVAPPGPRGEPGAFYLPPPSVPAEDR